MTEAHAPQEDFESNLDHDETVVEDGSENYDAPIGDYIVSNFGWGSDVEGLVNRLRRGEIHVPSFQRKFVWNRTEQSRFIESLLLGLPVPSIFLAKDAAENTEILNIVDGQQRLISLRDYLDGNFYLSGNDIHEKFRGRYFSREVAKTKKSKVLSGPDSRNLTNTIIHSIVIRPEFGRDASKYQNEYNRAVIQIFNRINTSGKPLQPHEIRASIFHGNFEKLLRELNKCESWRFLFGSTHPRLKDMECILRYIAIRENHANYHSPMKKFLDDFMGEYRTIEDCKADEIKTAFTKTTELLVQADGHQHVRSGNRFSLPRFDALMFGVDVYRSRHSNPRPSNIKKLITKLNSSRQFNNAISASVNNADRVQMRLNIAKKIFGA